MISQGSLSAGSDTVTLYLSVAIGCVLSDVAHDIRERAFSTFIDRSFALVEQTVQFQFAIKHLIGLDAHNNQTPPTVLSNKHRLATLMAEHGYLIVYPSRMTVDELAQS